MNTDFLTETENSFYIKKEDVSKLNDLENFIPLDAYLENAPVTISFFNVIGFINEKTVIVL